MPLSAKARSLLIAASGGHAALFGYLLASGNETFYDDFLMPLAHFLIKDGETSHNLMVKACRFGLVPASTFESERLKSRIFDLDFDSPLGIAAGFDKNGEAIHGVYRMGFDFMEVGSVTPQPQTGNAKPRVFRLQQDRAIINRFGFPSAGEEATLRNIRQSLQYKRGPLGINLGANKISADVVGDFVEGVKYFRGVADFFVINVSSPNTPGLRLHQQRDNLEKLLKAVMSERDSISPRVPVLLKVAPDLLEEDRKSIAEISLKMKVDGLVISNTTIQRPESLQSEFKNEIGGLSGAPLRDFSLTVLTDLYRLTKGRIPIIGVGGIDCGKDAYERIRAGASLVQIYTALAYHGPPVVTKIKKELDTLLEKDGFASVSDAVGVDSAVK